MNRTVNNGKKPTSRNYQNYLIESLQDPVEAAAYIKSVLEDGDPELLQSALKDVAQDLCSKSINFSTIVA